MPIVEFTYTSAENRTPEMMRGLISKLTDAVVEAGVAPKSAVRVVLRELPPEHFAAGDETIAERREKAAAQASTTEKGNGANG